MVSLRIRSGFKFYQPLGFCPLDIFTRGIMVLIRALEAYETGFRLSVWGWRNGLGRAGRWAGHGAFLGVENRSFPGLPMPEIIQGICLGFALEVVLIPYDKMRLAVGPEVQLGPEPLVPIIKRQAGSLLGPEAQSGAALALRVPQV